MKYHGIKILLHTIYLIIGIIIPTMFQYSYDKVKKCYLDWKDQISLNKDLDKLNQIYSKK